MNLLTCFPTFCVPFAIRNRSGAVCYDLSKHPKKQILLSNDFKE